jgi:hypothetical protein
VNDLRESALVLHGLAPSDRDWLLSRLPGERADELRVLIDELQTLGLPADATLTARALRASQPTPNAAAVAPTLPATAAQTIASASAEQMQRVLHEEADQLLAIVASSSVWRWRARWLSRMEPLRAERVRKLMLDQSPTPSLREAVLDAVAHHLRELPAAPPDAPMALMQRARDWFMQRTESMSWHR